MFQHQLEIKLYMQLSLYFKGLTKEIYFTNEEFMLLKAQIIHENDLKNGFGFVYLLYTIGKMP
jgi:hypothetical protein